MTTEEVKGKGCVFSKKARKIVAEKSQLTLPKNKGMVRSIEDALCEEYFKVGIDHKATLSDFKKDLKAVPEENRTRFVLAYDTETTGRDLMAKAVSIGLVLYDIQKDVIADEFYSIINPKKEVDTDAEDVHLISKEKIETAPEFKELSKQISSFFERADMCVGHSLSFDMRILFNHNEELDQCDKVPFEMEWFDTMDYSPEYYGETDEKGKPKKLSLGDCCARSGISIGEDEMYHNALTDAKASLSVFLKMINLSEG